MYSHEERLKAVKLYIKYEHSLAATIQKLGYPSPKALSFDEACDALHHLLTLVYTNPPITNSIE